MIHTRPVAPLKPPPPKTGREAIADALHLDRKTLKKRSRNGNGVVREKW